MFILQSKIFVHVNDEYFFKMLQTNTVLYNGIYTYTSSKKYQYISILLNLACHVDKVFKYCNVFCVL